MFSSGPIASLRLWGVVCPCLEREEDKSARISLRQLHTLGARVDWHVGGGNKAANAAASASRFVRGLFGNGNATAEGEGGENVMTASIKLVDATSDAINNGLPYPELQIKPLNSKQKGSGGEDGDGDIEMPQSRGIGGMIQRHTMRSIQLDIPLHHLVRVEATESNLLLLHVKDVHNTNPAEKNPTKVGAKLSISTTDSRNALCHDLLVLMEWNRVRQPEVEEDLPALGLKARAAKAAHFAKREKNMRDTKRSREQRKAELMGGSVGLKYTALAMANRAQGELS